MWMRCDENNGSMILEGNETESRALWVVDLWMAYGNDFDYAGEKFKGCW